MNTSTQDSEYQEQRVNTLAQFVSQVNAIDRVFECDNVLYRGQSQSFELLPKIARAKLFDVVESEKRILEDFRKESRPYLLPFPNSHWDLLAIAQHHGLPTRLLDWSTNPLVALWFAVRDTPSKSENGSLVDGVVWVFESMRSYHIEEKVHPFEIESIKVFSPAHSSKRIVAQSGWFTCHNLVDGKFFPLENNSIYQKQISKIIIASEAFSRLKNELDLFGISYRTLFPDLVGVCTHIGWKHLSELEHSRQFYEFQFR